VRAWRVRGTPAGSSILHGADRGDAEQHYVVSLRGSERDGVAGRTQRCSRQGARVWACLAPPLASRILSAVVWCAAHGPCDRPVREAGRNRLCSAAAGCPASRGGLGARNRLCDLAAPLASAQALLRAVARMGGGALLPARGRALRAPCRRRASALTPRRPPAAARPVCGRLPGGGAAAGGGAARADASPRLAARRDAAAHASALGAHPPHPPVGRAGGPSAAAQLADVLGSVGERTAPLRGARAAPVCRAAAPRAGPLARLALGRPRPLLRRRVAPPPAQRPAAALLARRAGAGRARTEALGRAARPSSRRVCADRAGAEAAPAGRAVRRAGADCAGGLCSSSPPQRVTSAAHR